MHCGQHNGLFLNVLFLFKKNPQSIVSTWFRGILMHRNTNFLTADSDIALYAFIRWKTTHGMRRWLLPKPEELPADSHPPASQTASVSRTLTLTTRSPCRSTPRRAPMEAKERKTCVATGTWRVQSNVKPFASYIFVFCTLRCVYTNASYMMHNLESCNDSIIAQLHNLARVLNVCTVPWCHNSLFFSH